MANLRMQQLIKGERHLFSSSDDSVVMKQVQATHAPDGREVEVRTLFRIVEDVFHQAMPTVMPQSELKEMTDDKYTRASVNGMLEALSYTIHRISCEISCKCTGGGDAHATTLAVFNDLSNYTWDAKVILALSAFAVTYGEFWLTSRLEPVNPLARSVALLKQLPDVLVHAEVLKPRFDAIGSLVRVMLNVTKCIINFKELPAEYITQDSADLSMAMAHIPTAVYWTIRGLVACDSQVIGLIGLGYEHITSTTEAWELSSLAHKLTNIHDHLSKQLTVCHRHVDGKKHMEAYNTIVRLFETPHIDNNKILRALFYSSDDLPLVDALTSKRCSVDVLRRKTVLLFISDLDVSDEELFVLIQIYNDPENKQLINRSYEIVWLPVAEREDEEAFRRLSKAMPWFSVEHPRVVDKAVVRYVREAWGFQNKPLLVVLDPQGKVVCPNAMPMMWIWGSMAFPFTSAREEALWRGEMWRIEFLVDEIDPSIAAWVKEGRYVCLYGGEDIEWIREFTTTLRRVAHEAKIPIELVYVGKSNPKERVRKATAAIAEGKLSHYWQDPTMVWFFWVRLESMWYSKVQHGRSIEDDPIMREVMSMLSFDGSEEGWAVITRGPTEFVKAQGRKMVECLGNFEKWKASVEAEGFVEALGKALVPYNTHEHHTRLILPGDSGKMEERVVCSECLKPMEKFVLYRCCNT